MNKKIIMFSMLILVIIIAGCQRPSDMAAYNLDIEAEKFSLVRRIAAINGITNDPLFEVVGYCSIETGGSYVSGAMEIVCEVGRDEYTKDFIYLSDNVLIVVEQLNTVDVPKYHYQMIFTPQSLLPVPEIVGGALGD